MLSQVGQGEWGEKPFPGQSLGIPDCEISHSLPTKDTHSVHQIPANFLTFGIINTLWVHLLNHY